MTVELELRGAEVVEGGLLPLARSAPTSGWTTTASTGSSPARGGAEEPWAEPLAAARAAAAALQARARGPRRAGGRVGRAGVRLRPPRPRRRGGAASVQTESHRLIEHLMIAANEAVARLLDERDVPALYRVHERPEPRGGPAAGRRSSRRSACRRRRCPSTWRRRRPRTIVAQASRARRPARAPHRARPPGADVAGAALAQAGALLAARTSATPACSRRATATSPRRSAAIPTSSATARC